MYKRVRVFGCRNGLNSYGAVSQLKTMHETGDSLRKGGVFCVET